MNLRVGVLGAAGRMGALTCRAVTAAPGLELVAQLDVDDSLDQLSAASVEVAVDFTHPDSVLDNIEQCARRGIHVVAGTTGFDETRLAATRAIAQAHPEIAIMVVPNFALGAVLMMRFASQAARFYESVEIIELHHPDKIDAPSGTARLTARHVAAARRAAGLGANPDATDNALDGARGALVDGVHVHSVRLRGLVAHQEVIFGASGETLTLRHDSLDRSSFMPGVLIAVRAAPTRPGLTIGLEDLVDIDLEQPLG